MVRQSAGEKKKQLIIDTCKVLFYDKGYANTTYDDICQAADIPPGSITYHFDGKRGIAAAIQDEFEGQNKIYIEKICGDKFSKTQLMVIENFNMWHRDLDDENLRRFLLDVSADRIPPYAALAVIRYFYQCVIEDLHITDIDEKELGLITAAQIGMSDTLFLAFAAHRDVYDADYLARFGIRFFLRQLGVCEGDIRKYIEEGYELYQSLPIDNRYFTRFSYDDKFVTKI